MGLVFANILYAEGIPNYQSRKVAHIFSGFAVLCAVIWLPATLATLMAGVFTLALITSRVCRPSLLVGVGGSARPEKVAELTFPIAVTVCLAVGWLWLGNRWLAFLPVGFLAFGDAITGLVRSWHCKREKKGWCGTLAMMGTCLILSLLLTPIWVGVVMGVVATAVEKLTPPGPWWLDDNWTLTLGSLLVGAVLYVNLSS